MATTPNGVPYPLGTDHVVDGDDAIHALATFLDPAYGPYIPYVPTFTGLTPGTSAVVVARYQQVGKGVRAWGSVTLGSGFVVGAVTMNTPVPVHAAHKQFQTLGRAMYRNPSSFWSGDVMSGTISAP